MNDQEPGISRRRRGRGFQYRRPDGRALSRRDLARVRGLAVPPAWTDVWICTSQNGHIQATGRDSRGRKQYRYHDRWNDVRDATKYERMLAFGRALPRIRRRVDRDMARRRLSREKVVATVVHLLDTTNIRVGNDEYARENRSFGLTTIRERHVDVTGSRLRFRFRGKGGIAHDVEITDARVARVVQRCEELPGQHLFQYLDEHDEPTDIQSEDVNEYLQRTAGEDFTAKDFRTWSGTVLAAWALDELGGYDSDSQAKRQLLDAVESVATDLGNTPAVCRRCYVHPEVFKAHLDGTLRSVLTQQASGTLTRKGTGLSPREAAVLELLRRRLQT
ncbi:MAG TPA: hypothetical protein VFQ71_12635 [Gaiellales bacterium]|nr:hypothetical protein [Gaiellales bacterium]